MEELSIEQKAKRYDDLLVRLQEAKVNNDVCDDRYCCVIDDIVPELVEIENERVRKAILSGLKYLETELGWDAVGDVDILDTYAWLEEQGKTFTKKDVDDAYLKGVCDAKQELEKQGEQKPAWSEEDETYSNHIVTAVKSYYTDDKGKENPWRKELLRWLKSTKDRVQPKPKQECSEEDEDYINDLIKYFSQNERLKNTKEDIAIWLKSLKERVTAKKEWSEEDENRFSNLISLVEHSSENGATKNGFINFINRLKSLRP